MKKLFDSENLYNKIEQLTVQDWIYIQLWIIAIGIIINLLYPYPWFYRIMAVMCVISTIAIFSERYFIKHFHLILEQISGFGQANSVLMNRVNKYKKSRFVYYYSAGIILYFGSIGLLLLNFYPSFVSLLYILLFFAFTVFISMIGYTQYLFLVRFMIQFSKLPKPQKRFAAQVPAETDWVVEINKLINVYNISFFVLSAIYIIAVYFFCFNYHFGVLIHGMTQYTKIILSLCWGVISVAIGLVLPSAYAIEYISVKKCIRQVKDERIGILNTDLSRGLTENKYSIESLIMLIKMSPNKPQGNYVTNIASFIIWLGGTLGSLKTLYDILSTSIS